MTLERLQSLSERIGRASALLATRASVARERQNRSLLASMDRRAKLQLRLQQTVQSVSVVAIVYYAAGLVGYVVKGLHEVGGNVSPDAVMAASVPVLAALVVLVARAARRRIFGGE